MAGRNPLDDGYKMVAERHLKFVADHPNGVISTDLVNSVFDPDTGKGFVVVKAKVWKDRANAVAGELADGTGLASMPIPGVTNFTRNSEVENTETSAIGRALAAIGYHPKDTMASHEEIDAKKAEPVSANQPVSHATETATSAEVTSEAPVGGDKLSDEQRRRIFALAAECGIDTKTKAGKEVLAKIRLQKTGKFSSAQMTLADGAVLIEHLETMKKLAQAAGGTVTG